MIYKSEISFEGLQETIDNWYKGKDFELGDPPINAQFALDLIFKTLIDDKKHYPYLTTMPESTEQTNSIMLDLILNKYSNKYRRFVNKILWRKKHDG
jgi:trehalose-6-phosphate synthase